MTVVEIDGIDEGGRVGELIFFVRLGVPLPSEMRLIVHNLNHFDTPIMKAEDLRGKDSKNLLKYAKTILDDRTISASVFILRRKTQLQLMRLLQQKDLDQLFLHRRTIVDMMRDKSEEVDLDKLSPLTSFLDAYQNPSVYIESFVKAYGMQFIAHKLASLSRLYQLSESERLLVLQVDGGFPFVFWWGELLASPSNPFKGLGKVYFSGITNGDEYYPVLSSAGAIASTLAKYPPSVDFLPVYEIPGPESFQEPSDAFFQNHHTSLIRPTFQQRMLFLGQVGRTIQTLLPYSAHRKNRSNTYEPFHVDRSIEGFAKAFGLGTEANTEVMYGTLTSAQDKSNLKFCKDWGLPCSHVSEKWDLVDSFFADISSEIDLLPSSRSTELATKLQKVKLLAQNESK